MWEYEAVTSAYHLDDTARHVILPATRICLVHGVELGTTAINLRCVNQYDLRGEIYLHLSRMDSPRRARHILSSRRNRSTLIQALGPQFDGFSA